MLFKTALLIFSIAAPQVFGRSLKTILGFASVDWIAPTTGTSWAIGDRVEIKIDTHNMGRILSSFDYKMIKINLLQNGKRVKTIINGNFNDYVKQKHAYSKVVAAVLAAGTGIGKFSQNHWEGVGTIPWTIYDDIQPGQYQLELEVRNGYGTANYGAIGRGVKPSPVFTITAKGGAAGQMGPASPIGDQTGTAGPIGAPGSGAPILS